VADQPALEARDHALTDVSPIGQVSLRQPRPHSAMPEARTHQLENRQWPDLVPALRVGPELGEVVHAPD
jgi:hypothetical protein